MTPVKATHTPPRQMRIPDDEWLPFGEATKSQEASRAEVVRDFIRWYLRRPGAKLPPRPEAGPWSTPKDADEKPAAQN
ncbi:hypothetical protein ACIRVF_07930 [Kitasatospora sp. NPDC101157]|uniref:hypothetical protein n=1 Tax=Kitasatospora sp. NPDC101157 TaxID=3364098 RepID=UPI003829EF27